MQSYHYQNSGLLINKIYLDFSYLNHFLIFLAIYNILGHPKQSSIYISNQRYTHQSPKNCIIQFLWLICSTYIQKRIENHKTSVEILNT